MLKKSPKKEIPIELVPSHIHLSKKHEEVLFGKDFKADVYEPLSQKGQFVYKQTVTVKGEEGEINNMRVLGPVRTDTQVELTKEEAAMIGVAAPERISGERRGAKTCVLIGPHGKIEAKRSVIIPKNHLHCNPDDAKRFKLTHGQIISMQIVGKSQVIDLVIVRVHPTFRLSLHVRSDIARSHWIQSKQYATILD